MGEHCAAKKMLFAHVCREMEADEGGEIAEDIITLIMALVDVSIILKVFRYGEPRKIELAC